MPFIIRGGNVEAEISEGLVIVHSGAVILKGNAAVRGENSALPPSSGDIVREGPNKGWVYCEGAHCDPFLVAPKDSGVMRWHQAMDFASHHEASLPSGIQLQAMYQARDMGALKGTFNAGRMGVSVWYWSSAQSMGIFAWAQRFCDGFGYWEAKCVKASARTVRSYVPQ